MKAGQDAIDHVTADTYAAAKNSPHLEVFRKHGRRSPAIRRLRGRVDAPRQLTEFDGKPLQSVAQGDLDIARLG